MMEEAIKTGLIIAKENIEKSIREDPVFYMTNEERVKKGYMTDNFRTKGYPFTRKGINYNAMKLGFVKGNKEGEYLDIKPNGKETIYVFNGIGFSQIKKRNHWEKYMNIK